MCYNRNYEKGMENPMEELSPEERHEINMDTLELWARGAATRNTARFDAEAQAAEIVLGLIELGQIVGPAEEGR